MEQQEVNSERPLLMAWQHQWGSNTNNEEGITTPAWQIAENVEHAKNMPNGLAASVQQVRTKNRDGTVALQLPKRPKVSGFLKKPAMVKVVTPKKVEAPSTMQIKATRTSGPKKASDPYGCRHFGINEIEQYSMDKATVKVYLKHGLYLHGKMCSDCKLSTEKISAPLNSMLPVLYYCEEGSKALFCCPTKSAVAKAELDCDFVLCVRCFEQRKSVFSDKGGNTKRDRKGAGFIMESL